MSRKLRANKYLILDAVDSTNPITSTETGVKQLDTVLYEIDIDATVNAVLVVEGSTDQDNSTSKVFNELDFGAPLTLIGAADTKYQVLIRDNAFNFLRLSISNNGGTGDISAWVSGVSKGA
jgi:hypothetical protein